MKPKHLYLFLCIVGIVIPFIPFAPFVHQHGLDVVLIFNQLFATPISSFFGLDVVVATLVLWILVGVEGRRVGMRRLWAPVLASLTVGISLGLPLFLYMRERRMEEGERARTSGGRETNTGGRPCPGSASGPGDTGP